MHIHVHKHAPLVMSVSIKPGVQALIFSLGCCLAWNRVYACRRALVNPSVCMSMCMCLYLCMCVNLRCALQKSSGCLSMCVHMQAQVCDYYAHSEPEQLFLPDEYSSIIASIFSQVTSASKNGFCSSAGIFTMYIGPAADPICGLMTCRRHCSVCVPHNKVNFAHTQKER
jgi:hypothetical protein